MVIRHRTFLLAADPRCRRGCRLPVLPRGAGRPVLLLVAPPSGAALHQPHRFAGPASRIFRSRAQDFLAKVRGLVQDVVEGDFDQIEIYEQKLATLEHFVAEQAARKCRPAKRRQRAAVREGRPVRLRQLYAQQLAGELQAVAAPAFLRDFVSRVWSQALMRAAEHRRRRASPQAAALRGSAASCS
jgi:hypothetical protein